MVGGTLQHEELYLGVTALGRLRTTGLEPCIYTSLLVHHVETVLRRISKGACLLLLFHSHSTVLSGRLSSKAVSVDT